MTDVLKPRDAQDVAAAIQWALGQSKTLDLVGAGSKRELGRPTQTDADARPLRPDRRDPV